MRLENVGSHMMKEEGATIGLYDDISLILNLRGQINLALPRNRHPRMYRWIVRQFVHEVSIQRPDDCGRDHGIGGHSAGLR